MANTMRIKIKGEITAERLAEALQAAAEKYEAVRPGHKVYGANLYLTAFDADGLSFDLANHSGEPHSITIEAKSCELVKPALTAEGEARRQKAKEKANRQAEDEAMHRQTIDKHEQEWLKQHKQELQKRREMEAEERKHFDEANTVTAELLKNMPERFLDELNKTVQGVWNDLKPTEKQGKKKGQPKAMPVFSIHADGLMLSIETWMNPRRVLNPYCTINNGKLMPLWAHDAWHEAMVRMSDLMRTLLKERSSAEAQ